MLIIIAPGLYTTDRLHFYHTANAFCRTTVIMKGVAVCVAESFYDWHSGTAEGKIDVETGQLLKARK